VTSVIAIRLSPFCVLDLQQVPFQSTPNYMWRCSQQGEEKREGKKIGTPELLIGITD